MKYDLIMEAASSVKITIFTFFESGRDTRLLIRPTAEYPTFLSKIQTILIVQSVSDHVDLTQQLKEATVC